MFAFLEQRRGELEKAFGSPLHWRRNDDLKKSHIVYKSPFAGHDKEAWPEMAEWIADNMKRMQATFESPLNALRRSKS